MPEVIPQLDEFRNITRMEYPRTGKGGQTLGWWVRMRRGDKNFSHLFSDNKYGGKENALEEAKRFRDKLEKEHGELLDLGYRTSKTNRNTSGVVGIHKGPKTTKRPSGRVYTYQNWIAHWVDPVTGKTKNRSFSIAKHGEAGAMMLALKTREEAIALISGVKQAATITWGQTPLVRLVEAVENSQTPNAKGRALEELAYRLFEAVPGFSINGSNVQTETEEIDIILLNNNDDPRFRRESAILLVECKNWTSKCGKNEFVLFKEKVENRSSRCTLGFLISWNGFAETVTKEMLRGSREQTLVIPIEGSEIKRAIQAGDFFSMLTNAYDKAISM